MINNSVSAIKIELAKKEYTDKKEYSISYSISRLKEIIEFVKEENVFNLNGWYLLTDTEKDKDYKTSIYGRKYKINVQKISATPWYYIFSKSKYNYFLSVNNEIYDLSEIQYNNFILIYSELQNYVEDVEKEYKIWIKNKLYFELKPNK